MAIDISDTNFEAQVLEQNDTVLVDFWAPWCGPCRQLGPVLEDISTEMAEVIKVMKMNIDENPNTPSKYGVRGIPTMMIFKGGKHIATKVGALPKTSLVEWINTTVTQES